MDEGVFDDVTQSSGAVDAADAAQLACWASHDEDRRLDVRHGLLLLEPHADARRVAGRRVSGLGQPDSRQIGSHNNGSGISRPHGRFFVVAFFQSATS